MQRLGKLVDLGFYKVFDRMIFPKNWSEYPPEYNREIHGPFDPSKYYGKRDTPFSEVKLSELAAWWGRRKKTPSAFAAFVGRTWYKYQANWVQVKNPAGVFIYQMIAMSIVFNYILDYPRYTSERWYRYH